MRRQQTASPETTRSGGRKAIALVASLVLAAGIGELVARLVLPRPGFVELPVVSVGGVMVSHPERGHAYAPNLRRHFVTDDFEIDFETNDLGMRDRPIEVASNAALRILAVGDSYTQGHGVQEQAAWPRQLEARLAGSRVYNTGVSGYSLQQMRVTAELFAPRLHPDLIVVGLYAYGYTRVRDPMVLIAEGSGLVRRSRIGKVRAVDGGVLVASFQTPVPRRITFWLDEHFYIGAHALHALSRARGWYRRRGATPWARPEGAALREDMNPALEELSRLRSFAQERGIPIIALLINPQEPDGSFSAAEKEYNEIILSYAREQDICVVDPLPRMEALASGRPVFRFTGDRHWNAPAQALAAEVLLSTVLDASSETSGRVSEESACRAARDVLASFRS